MAAALLSLALAGCGRGGVTGPAVMSAPELGLSMNAPAGWRLFGPDARMSASGDSTAVIIDEPLEGREFRGYVRRLSEDHRGKVLSMDNVTVSGFDAVEALVDYPDAGSRVLKVYIRRDETLVEVSFAAPANDFSRHEQAIRESITSITIR